MKASTALVANRGTFQIVVNFITGDWGYEVHDGDTYLRTVRGFESYEEAYKAGIESGLEWPFED